MKLAGKTVAITGAGRGIGRAAAELFAREGARVALLEKDAEQARVVADAIRAAGGTALELVVDVAGPQAMQAAFERIDAEFGSLHVLYNNASIYLDGLDAAIDALELDIWQKVLAVNLNGLFYACKFGLPLIMRSGGGAVINTASSAGVIGIPNCDAYTASKGATVALTRSLAVEYGPRGVRVNCIAPAAIATPMMRASNPADSPRFDEARFLGLRAPLRRYGTPREIAALALFLASDESAYINGAIIVADGGITINGDLSKLATD